jgi:hypothetical protein
MRSISILITIGFTNDKNKNVGKKLTWNWDIYIATGYYG